MNTNIIRRIEDGPVVLFIGQGYLSRDSGNDVFLKKILEKYNGEPSGSATGYDSILKLSLNNNYESVLTWMTNLCRSISTPQWLEIVAKLPISAVYTSVFDSILERAFINEWRQVQPVTEENFRVTNSRSQINLHVTYLLGNIIETEQSKRPPLSLIEKARRKFTYTTLLKRLPEIVTPRGVLIVDGYTLADQIQVEDIYPMLSKFTDQQILFCGASEDLKANEYITDLIQSNKVVAVESSFPELLVEWQSKGLLKIKGPDDPDLYGKWLTIQDKKVKIPQDIFIRVSKTATILDDKIFHKKLGNDSNELYDDFKKFLSSTNSTPFWPGFLQNFAFKRDYYTSLHSEVTNRLRNSDQKEIPIILHGQASSGKTTSLGLLAFELRNTEKYPVLFIEKRYQKIDETDIDFFCKWAEDNGAKNTVVIWDGMIEPDIYYNVLRKLNTRGRNIILVGSCYTYAKSRKNLDNFIEAPITLSLEEKKRFTAFVDKIDPSISTLMYGFPGGNLLSMLYRYLPSSRSTIKQGLKGEYDFFIKLIDDEQRTEQQINKSQLYENLKQSGIIDEQALVDLKEEIIIDNDVITLADQLIFSIMVPGKYGLPVPFGLLLRTIGYEGFSSKLFKALNEVNIIEWISGNEGEWLLGPRTAMEAQILTTYLGSKEAEVDYIILLLRHITAMDFASFGGEADSEVHFAVELLNKIGPNSQQDFSKYLYEFAQELKFLREGGYAYHPRLILKEASFLRELLKNPNLDIPESRYEILERAEEIVRDALGELQDYQERTITTFLKGELAAILGTKIKSYIKDGRKSEAKECYEILREPFNTRFASSPENYSALDVLAWTTEDLIQANIFSDTERFNAETELLNYFELAEIEGVSDQYLEDFNRRRLEISELIGKSELAEKTFNILRENGYASGYYFRAKKILGFDSNLHLPTLKDDVIEKCQSAYEYLSQNYEDIDNDGKCLFLMLNCWWISKTKRSFFSEERQLVPFSQQDWQQCLTLINLLLALESVYQSATILYLKGIAEFHLGLYKDSIVTFRTLDQDTNYTIYGRRRITKFFLASNADGTAKIFSGQVKRAVSTAKHDKKGDIFVNEIREVVPFLLNDFIKSFFQEGERVHAFNIGFSFRGSIAVPQKK